MSNFKERYITVIIGIGAGAQGDQAPGTMYTLENYRISAEINAYGGQTQGSAHVRIYGMSVSLMNALTAIGYVLYQRRYRNTIQILAGDDPASLSTIYNGVIDTAFADYNNAPDVCLDIQALGATVAAMTPAAAYHHAGPTKVSEIMSTLAAKLGWGFSNLDIGPGNLGVGGDDVELQDPVFQGSYWSQITTCADQAGIIAYHDVVNAKNVLKIKHLLSNFTSDVITVSPDTNMVGYPVFSQSFTLTKMLFEPRALMGGKLTISNSFVLPANRDWLIITVEHNIESIMPDGKWFTTCGLMPAGLVQGT